MSYVVIDRTELPVVLKREENNYVLTENRTTVVVRNFTNIADQGEPGEGVPTGGPAGQVLAKIDGDDYNTEWVNQASGGTTYSFSASTSWAINHNRGYTPLISCFSLGGVELIADVVHLNTNQAVVNFSTSTAGTARVA
jgi:hypothetical protein